MFVNLQLARSSHTQLAWRFHVNTNTFFYNETKVRQKQEMSLPFHYCNIKYIPYMSHSSLILSTTKIKRSI